MAEDSVSGGRTVLNPIDPETGAPEVHPTPVEKTPPDLGTMVRTHVFVDSSYTADGPAARDSVAAGAPDDTLIGSDAPDHLPLDEADETPNGMGMADGALRNNAYLPGFNPGRAETT